MNDKDIFEISERTETEEIKESEIIELEYEREPVETWETVEPTSRVKKLNGVAARYEVKIDFGEQEVYSKKRGTFITRQDKRTKSFKILKEAQHKFTTVNTFYNHNIVMLSKRREDGSERYKSKTV